MPERDDPTEEQDLYEEIPPRSIFAATWFRVLLVVIVLGVVGAVAFPYVLDWMNPPPSRSASKTPAPATPASSAPATPTPAGPAPAADKERKDSTLIPAPAPTVPTARPEPKAEPRVATAKPVEPKPAAPKPAPSAPPKAEPKPAPVPAERPVPGVTSSETPSKAAAAKAETKPAAPKRVAAKAAATGSANGSYWVQVGAFKDAETARRVAAKLRAENFKVEESVVQSGGAPAPSAPKPAAPAARAPSGDIGADQYDVFVTGQTPEELNKRLAGKGLAAEPSGAGMVVKPSLPLRDAVALSKDLAVEGFKVQVKRAGGPMSSAVAAPSAPAPARGGGEALHRVRVGAFPDRATAQAAVKELQAKGYKPYIARGDQ